ncbi:hypothetical protein SAMN04488550_4548 [Gordonia malaquae]|nr:hypothetical protein SAMN04488550_4548 [Gordonia malaquae]
MSELAIDAITGAIAATDSLMREYSGSTILPAAVANVRKLAMSNATSIRE